MLKQALLAATLLAAAPAIAQTDCPPPVLKVMQNNQEVPSTPTAFTPKVTLLVSPGPACAGQVSYRFTEAEMTLFRGLRPVLATRVVRQGQADLSSIKESIKPGDHIFIFVAYKNLTVVSADGKERPYPVPQRPAIKPNSTMEESLADYAARGAVFTWLLP